MTDWSRRHSVGLAAAATFAIHLLYLSRKLGSDEGGYAVVARFWASPGDYLYGPQWVDRPPGLITAFWIADHLGPYGVRLLAGVFAVVMVLAVADAARTLSGQVAARWSAWAAFALASSTFLDAQSLDGELAAGAFVALSVAAVLRATKSPRRKNAAWFAVGAGAAASVAVLMKQNFVDAFAFSGVLLLLAAVSPSGRRWLPLGRTLRTAGWFALGALMPLGAALVWTTGRGGPSELLYAMYGFRADATAVMVSWSWSRPLHRLETLLLFAVASGLLILLLHLSLSYRRKWLGFHPLPWAVTAATVVALVGVAGGANFWSHYLIALVPMVTLTAGLAARRSTRGWRRTRRLILLAVAVTAIVTPGAALAAMDRPDTSLAAGDWIADSARSTDTLTVTFSHANVLYASGLAPAYPYAWSLPIRTLDPQLALMATTLSGADAPTWVIEWDGLGTWDLDAQGWVQEALNEHYRPVTEVCGHQVWLHNGVERTLAPPVPDSQCHSEDD